jgi:hypothetical protein
VAALSLAGGESGHGSTPGGTPEPVNGSIAAKETWEARLQKGQIEFSDLVRLKYWQAVPKDAPDPTLGTAFYDRALDVFKASRRGFGISARYSVEVAIFGAPGCGVLLTPEGTFRYTVMERAIGFDWSPALGLLHRVDALTRRSRELWRVEMPARPPQPAHEQDSKQLVNKKEQNAEADKPASSATGKKRAHQRPPKTRTRQKAGQTRSNRAALTQLRPHSERAYDLCTSVFSAINIEKLTRSEHDGDEKLRRQPSQEFERRIDLIRPEVGAAESAFLAAAQRHAQVRYGAGMALGVFVLTLLCIALAIVFAVRDVPAWYGIACATGGLGAVVSVLQRMASGRLKLDYSAGNGMLVTLGAVRPLIGAIFGMVVFAIFDGGWLPSIEVSHDSPVSFYAVLGFLAGFNERFAQDMLVGSAKQLSQGLEGVDRSDSTTGVAAASKSTSP